MPPPTLLITMKDRYRLSKIFGNPVKRAVEDYLTLRLLMSYIYIYIYIYIYDISSLRVNNLTLILLNVEKMVS